LAHAHATAPADLEAAADDDYPPTPIAVYSLALLFLAYVLSFLDRQVLTLLVGPIRAEYGLTDFEFSLLQGAAFAFVYCLAALPLGRLADRSSRRMIIACSVFGWSLATCACGLARGFPQLVAARMGVGAGEAGLSPPAYSMIVDSFPPRTMGYAMAVYKLGVTIGGGVALIIGGGLFEYFSGLGRVDIPFLGEVAPWKATFITIGVPGFVLAALLLTMHEPKRKGLAQTREAQPAESLPIRTVTRFLWQRRRVYLPLFAGSALLAMAGYGTTAWYPEFLFRNYGLSKAEAGSTYGTVFIVAGTIGVLSGPALVGWLERRGYRDAYVRTILVVSLMAAVPGTLAPLAGSALGTLLLATPATLLGSIYLGIMAVSFQIITPNQMRGQTTAVYILVTTILGMAVGTSLLAALTDFVFQSDGAIHLSIATVNAVLYPAAALLFWFCLPAYRERMDELGEWKI
jgi:MFS family permease